MLGYIRLSRLDRPVGWRLLFLPCLMGLSLARIGSGFAWPRDALYALAMLIGAVVMRGAGCTYNDIVDREIDAKVERTRGRPLPAGQVTLRQAWIWIGVQCGIGLLCVLALPIPAIVIAFCAIPLVALYPFMKRITWWPQAWLGLCFSWGALVASVAAVGDVSAAGLLLFFGCVAWVIGYDTLYALQDIEDDALVGVRSTARLFGDRWRRWTVFFYTLAFALWLFAASDAGGGPIASLLLALLAAIAIVGVVLRVNPALPASALTAFKRNVWIGLAVAGAFALEAVLTR
jgi:4-hydroxybenzoate polyprenyltransferase